ncbi:uncharacterized protein LOC124818568 isoform X1 [Hydra vulgaris]|uniref:uncharacterized protein LOC124818568 isoform X1 n=1 Tax=Hydra vulgaris TaxID=6087 RepID=UPI0032EA0C0E
MNTQENLNDDDGDFFRKKLEDLQKSIDIILNYISAASSVTSKLFYSLILDLIYGLIGFIAFLTFFYLSLAAASSATTAASSVTSKLFYSLILDLIYGLIGFIAFLTFFYLSLAAASSVTSKLFYSLILDLFYGLIGFIAFLTFFYLSLAAASSVTSSKSWEDFRKYRSQYPGPLSMRAFHCWCLYGDDHPYFRWRDSTPYNTGNRADAGRRRQRGAKVVNNFFTY